MNQSKLSVAKLDKCQHQLQSSLPVQLTLHNPPTNATPAKKTSTPPTPTQSTSPATTPTAPNASNTSSAQV
ncbi:hypothetical protein PMZ80_005499 [Knufia obscura]|uniref:Uncharacterized protein n=2 Tax=Knufia TaxID=430999 RepID=A0AAN8EAE0_9EURO|nr:hypothetical protein PMZ80_005499 [Knufia obscura]KAK5949968.1 hypothetical protein OHC33_008929 [Knufia fluminis]